MIALPNKVLKNLFIWLPVGAYVSGFAISFYRLEFVEEVLHIEPYTRKEICEILKITVSLN